MPPPQCSSCRVFEPRKPRVFRARRAFASPFERFRFPRQRGQAHPRICPSGRFRRVPKRPHPQAQSPLLGPRSADDSTTVPKDSSAFLLRSTSPNPRLTGKPERVFETFGTNRTVEADHPRLLRLPVTDLSRLRKEQIRIGTDTSGRGSPAFVHSVSTTTAYFERASPASSATIETTVFFFPVSRSS